jgi:16S rRNA (guanine527-N7)-methyltransferase
MVDSQPWPMLEPYLIGSKAQTAQTMTQLKAFTGSVIRWNRTGSNIMSKHDEPRILVRHVAESLAPAKMIQERGLESWLDFGSGAGFPAIPLIIAGVGSSWLLVESRRQKTLFLRKTVESFALRNVEVATTRLESLERERGLVDGFTSRATEGLELTLQLAAIRVRAGGGAFLWRAGSRSAELQEKSGWMDYWELGEVTKIPDSLAEVVEFIRRDS